MSDVTIKISYEAIDSIVKAALYADVNTWKNKKSVFHPNDIEINKARIKAAKFLLKTWYDVKE